jgi:hypothetical protein
MGRLEGLRPTINASCFELHASVLGRTGTVGSLKNHSSFGTVPNGKKAEGKATAGVIHTVIIGGSVKLMK